MAIEKELAKTHKTVTPNKIVIISSLAAMNDARIKKTVSGLLLQSRKDLALLIYGSA